MATGEITPTIATPSAPAAAPAPVAAPAPAAAPTPAATPAVKSDESSAAFFTRVAEERKVAEPEKPAAAPEGGEPPKVEGAETKPIEAKPEEAKPADAKPDEKPVEVKPDGEEEPFEIQPLESLPPSKLAQALKSNPQLAAALDADPELKNSIFATARAAARDARFREHFQTPEEAGSAKQAADQFSDFFQSFMGAQDETGTRGFLTKIMDLTAELDDEGKPVKGADGQLKTDGTVGRFMDNVLSLGLGIQEKLAKENNDQDLLAAIDTFKARVFGGPASAEEEVDPQVKAQRDALNAERDTLRQQQRADAKQKEDEWERGVATSIETDVKAAVLKLVDQTDLADFNRNYVLDQITSDVYDKLKENRSFHRDRDAVMRRPMSDKTKGERVALAMRFAKPLIESVARAKFADAGVRLKNQRDAQVAKIDAQSKASRSEQRGSNAPAKPAEAPSASQFYTDAVEKLKAENAGREPSTAQVLQRVAEMRKKFASG